MTQVNTRSVRQRPSVQCPAAVSPEGFLQLAHDWRRSGSGGGGDLLWRDEPVLGTPSSRSRMVFKAVRLQHEQ
jgi:hypothetical protein